ncbi:MULTISPECIES: hypothetical protein [Dictyoglomus]|uniref:Uncharacterized protein n=1 Tax=Dictyoglomus turgidum (strain DSM 6724 / Z-1310) TaxID=515635 RepID=B8E0S9_DICTD|nr:MULTISPECIES: hypothetical protein [Dictyoglomus]ACK42666.1 conserved hypothetical protein [Dictyoglomus turgidum DSM 6724]PNV78904.1 MAG: hypothetical protein C0196_07660 [Dictyoglomus turgidum]HBU30725.1 hypothetical protein [Dictyoglomus sp.]
MDKESILKGLDGFSKLAKQDMLMSVHTENPEYWRKNAEARHDKYKELYKLVEEVGLDMAIEKTIEEYKSLKEENDPVARGKKRALESFFVLVGIDPSQL